MMDFVMTEITWHDEVAGVTISLDGQGRHYNRHGQRDTGRG